MGQEDHTGSLSPPVISDVSSSSYARALCFLRAILQVPTPESGLVWALGGGLDKHIPCEEG